MNDAAGHNVNSVAAFYAAMEAMMRGEHLPAAVEAREQRDRARSIAVQLEQENSRLYEVIAEYQRIIHELLEAQDKARSELILGRLNARVDLKTLPGDTS